MADATEAGLSFDPVDVGDFDEVEEKINRVLVPGEFHVRIVSADHRQGAKAQYLGWRLEVIDSADPEDNGYTLFYNTPIEGRGIGILVSFCNALGTKFPTPLTAEWVESLYGLELDVEVTVGEYNGNTRNEVKKAIAQSA
jgi:hypothetical protein